MNDLWDTEAVHTWFGLTYSNYLVIPRSVLQSMSDEWQKKFINLVQEAQENFYYLDWPDSYDVRARDSDTGRYIKDPIPHYNRGRTKLIPEKDSH